VGPRVTAGRRYDRAGRFGTTLYASHGDGRVIALAIADGRELWVRPIEGRPSPPLLVGDSLYVGSTGNRFYSLDARNGQPRWTWRTGGDVTGADFGAKAKTKAVYYTSLDAVLRAINPGKRPPALEARRRHALPGGAHRPRR
jgi:outer membrane protein assembly factor BamB